LVKSMWPPVRLTSLFKRVMIAAPFFIQAGAVVATFWRSFTAC